MKQFYFFAFLLVWMVRPVGGVAQTLADADRLLAEADSLQMFENCEGFMPKIEQSISIYEKVLEKDTFRLSNKLDSISVRVSYCNNKEAFRISDWALELRIKKFGLQSSSVAESYFNRHQLFSFNKDSINTVNTLLNSFKIFSIDSTNTCQMLKVLNTLGDMYDWYGDQAKTKYYYLKSLSLAKNEPCSEEAFERIIFFYEKIGNIDSATYYEEMKMEKLGVFSYDLLEKYIKIRNFEKFKNYSDKLLSSPVADTLRIYNYIIGGYEDIDDYEKAVEYLYLKLAFLKKRNNFNDLEREEYIDTYKVIGSAFLQKGDYMTAIEYYRFALTYVNDTDKILKTQILTSLGLAYSTIGNHNKAIEVIKQAYELMKNEFMPDLINANQLALANAYMENHQYANAIETCKKILEIKVPYFGKEYIESTCTLILGRTYILNKNYKEAYEILNESLYLPKNNDFIPHIYNELSFFYWSTKNYEKGIEMSNISIKHFKKSANNSGEDLNYIMALSLLQANKIGLYLKTSNINYLYESDDISSKIIPVVDTTINKLMFSDNKLSYSKMIWNLYENDLETKYELFNTTNNYKYLNHFFLIIEKCKTLGLREVFNSLRAKKIANAPIFLIEKAQRLVKEITLYDKRAFEIAKAGSSFQNDLQVVENKIFLLKRQLEELNNQIAIEYPNYHRLRYSMETVNLEYIQDTLLREANKSLISYFIGDSSIFIFAVKNGKDKILLKEIKKDFPLEEWVKQMQYGIYGFYGSENRLDTLRDNTYNSYVEAASKLYQKLIAPIDTFLTRNIIIIPDGVLGYIPFDALLASAPKNGNKREGGYWSNCDYWGNYKIISYAYSATSLKEMIDKQYETPPQYKGVLAFAPFYDGALIASPEGTTMDIADEEIDSLKSLDYSGIEVDSIIKIVGGKYYLSRYANRAILDSLGSKYPIIHLSTHAKADDRVGDYAYFALKSTKDTTKFEKIYAKDIYNMTFNADLVTLSACETSRGELKRGEGIISMGRAFAYAGAKSIVPSLWVVNDKRSEELMTAFYTNLMRGMRKDDALSTAKKDFIKNHKNDGFAHPYFWSAFIPIGDMKPIIFKP